MPRDHACKATAINEVCTVLFDMEPELRQIEGVLTLLSILGEAGDSIEPVALAALARSGQASFEELSALWRSGFEASKDLRKDDVD